MSNASRGVGRVRKTSRDQNTRLAKLEKRVDALEIRVRNLKRALS